MQGKTLGGKHLFSRDEDRSLDEDRPAEKLLGRNLSDIGF